MKREAVPDYPALAMDAAHGAGRLECVLCREVMAAGEPCFHLPSTCGDTDKWHAGQAFNSQIAHQRCVRQAFGWPA